MAKKRKKQREPGTRKVNWGIAIALAIAFLLGGVVGAVVERERVLNAREESAAASTTAADWFKAGDLSVCPPLQRWSLSVAASYTARGQGSADWGASRATQIRQSSETTASLQSLLPLVYPQAKSGVQSLIDHEADLREALNNATSLTEYNASRNALESDQVTHDLGILAQAVQFCPAG